MTAATVAPVATASAVVILIGMLLGESGDPRDPYANPLYALPPLYADLAGLPPLYIQVGGDESILDDARRLAERARKAGVEVRLDVLVITTGVMPVPPPAPACRPSSPQVKLTALT